MFYWCSIGAEQLQTIQPSRAGWSLEEQIQRILEMAHAPRALNR
jgi:hypothetical protein